MLRAHLTAATEYHQPFGVWINHCTMVAAGDWAAVTSGNLTAPCHRVSAKHKEVHRLPAAIPNHRPAKHVKGVPVLAEGGASPCPWPVVDSIRLSTTRYVVVGDGGTVVCRDELG